MPKLNVQQNNQNVIQAFKNALAIGNLKGIIASDGNHNFSTAGTNPNLLDNPFFTVRQRGNGPWTGGGLSFYTVDRWALLGNSPNTVTVYDDYISVASGNNGLAQYITPELGAFLNGKTVTLSVMDYNGNVASGTLVYSNTALLNTYQLTVDGVLCRIYCGLLAGRQLGFSLTVGTNNTVRIKAAKLELGSVSTLANDAPPDYAEELAKCQRYFYRISNTASYTILGSGIAGSASVAYIQIPTPVTMRVLPSVAVNTIGDLRLYCNGAAVSFTNLAIRGMSANGVTLTASGASGMSANYAVSLANTGTSAYIDISADL